MIDGKFSLLSIATQENVLHTLLSHIQSVSEIKGAPCARCAHFHCRVHEFWKGAPGVCTFFELVIITIYQEVAWGISRVHSFRSSAHGGCTK